MLIIHFPLFWRLRVDRLKRSVDQCGRKTFDAFTKRKRIRVDGASVVTDLFCNYRSAACPEIIHPVESRESYKSKMCLVAT